MMCSFYPFSFSTRVSFADREAANFFLLPLRLTRDRRGSERKGPFSSVAGWHNLRRYQFPFRLLFVLPHLEMKLRLSLAPPLLWDFPSQCLSAPFFPMIFPLVTQMHLSLYGGLFFFGFLLFPHGQGFHKSSLLGYFFYRRRRSHVRFLFSFFLRPLDEAVPTGGGISLGALFLFFCAFPSADRRDKNASLKSPFSFLAFRSGMKIYYNSLSRSERSVTKTILLVSALPSFCGGFALTFADYFFSRY